LESNQLICLVYWLYIEQLTDRNNRYTPETVISSQHQVEEINLQLFH